MRILDLDMYNANERAIIETEKLFKLCPKEEWENQKMAEIKQKELEKYKMIKKILDLFCKEEV